MLAAGSADAVAAGFDAGAVIREVAPLIGGRGGGKPAMAQAGGKDVSGIDAALQAARRCWVRRRIRAVRFLGLDIGERRIGVALSDPSGSVATPLQVLEAGAPGSDAAALKDLVAEHGVDRLVVGLPLTLAGEEGPQAVSVRGVADRLGRETGLPVDFVDERLTTAQARRTMRQGRSAKGGTGPVDMIAATLLLQAYLDARRDDDTESANA